MTSGGAAPEEPATGQGPTRSTRLAWLAAHVVTSFFAFPQLLAGKVLDAGLVLAPLVPLTLLLALRGLPPRRAAAQGWLVGLAAHAAILHWIYVVTVRYGHGIPPVGVVAVLALASYVAFFTGGFAAGASWLASRGRDTPLALALLWTCLDHLRSFAASGFPWATLGYAQHANPALLGLAAWTGVYGLSFAAALAGAGLASWLGGRRAAGLAALVVVALLHPVGWLAAADPEDASDPTLRIAVAQGNILQGVKWSPDWALRTLEIYEELTRQAADDGARLVVWPETAVPGSPDRDLELRRRLADLAAETGAALVVGAVGIDLRDDGALEFFDSGYLVDGSAGVVDRYDKTHLVPFGEYVPFRELLGRFVGAVATGIASGDVTPGPLPRAVELPGSVGADGSRVGIPICYELLFPDLVRRFVRDGAQVLLAITNDAWYGRTGAPHQFLVITAMRSAETHTWTARAANTGVSAFIDAGGNVRQQTPIFERGFLVEDVPLRTSGEETTFYVRHGDLFARFCWLGLALCLGFARMRPTTAGQEGQGNRR